MKKVNNMEKIKRNIAKLLISINDGEFDGYGQNTMKQMIYAELEKIFNQINKESFLKCEIYKELQIKENK
ncbi:hypothetical protein SDAV_00449 [Spiroplasma phoeniceum P40]|uniref:Uncharacterized protein n=3 Tax=Spiroplasmataceae TaxID=2131 RepID=A0A345DMK5_9MOLU|nr:hypothetical protein SDAV_00449 [Spiroplasma phoeniceum P40]